MCHKPVDDREGEGDALGRRLGRVFNGQHPGVGGGQLRAVGEERRYVAVGAQPQQDHIKNRQPYTALHAHHSHITLDIATSPLAVIVSKVGALMQEREE